MSLPWFGPEKFPLYLAPMAGFTDSVYRGICKSQGADVLVSEFVLADRLVDGDEKVWKTVDFSPDQRPMGVQIFGSDPEMMAEAGRRVRDRLAPDFLDLNFGCPSERITCQEAGSSLLRDLGRLGRVAGTVVRGLGEFPVTAKMRIGWDDESVVAVEAARILESEGIRAVAVHGRTKAQGYRGLANWEVIAEVAESVRIPVIGNGDIREPEDVLRVRQHTRCAGLMIGRAALGAPWIFSEIKIALATGRKPPAPDPAERLALLLEYARRLQEALAPAGHEGRIGWMRTRLITLTKTLRGGKRLRQRLNQIETMDELAELCQNFCRESMAVEIE